MDSKKHAEFMHSPAVIRREVGGEFSAFDDWAWNDCRTDPRQQNRVKIARR
jgi:hypothetical protein